MTFGSPGDRHKYRGLLAVHDVHRIRNKLGCPGHGGGDHNPFRVGGYKLRGRKCGDPVQLGRVVTARGFVANTVGAMAGGFAGGAFAVRPMRRLSVGIYCSGLSTEGLSERQ